MEFTFADGAKAFCGFRRINKARSDFATYIHGTKCAAQFCDYLDDLSAESPVPVTADDQGRFPVPIPGQWTEI